ncbi:MAG TPA: cytochrome c [Bryobacteraceae bacterium]|nr:cytochrome c [Bryobacteraceae bacterium]
MRNVIWLVPLLGLLLLPAQDKQTVQKVPVSPTSIASGKEMFNHYCAACHGPGGKGDGPAASSFKKAPRDLTKLARDNGGKYPAEHVAATLSIEECCVHGSKVMPVWGPILSSISSSQAEMQLRISNLVKYIETLQAP